jgi:hypothetical protein
LIQSKIQSLYDIENRLKDVKDTTIANIKSFTDNYDYRTTTGTIRLNKKEKDVLLNLGVSQKRIFLFESNAETEIDQNKKKDNRDKKGKETKNYNGNMILILNNQLEAIERTLNDLSLNPMNKMIKSYRKEKGTIREMTKQKNETDRRNLVAKIEKYLQSDFKDIENDIDIVKKVEMKMASKIRTKILTFQMYISNKKCTSDEIDQTNKYFDKDIDICILKSIIHLLVAISDWLEVDYITSNEIKCALSILLPFELLKYIPNEIDDNIMLDGRFQELLLNELLKYNLKIDDNQIEDVNIIVEAFTSIDSIDHQSIDYLKFNNRVKYFYG